METVRQILKDYGPAIGPALAFTFGILALFLKYQVDRWTASWSLSRRLRHLEHMVANSGPPETFFPNASPTFLHVDEARNLANLARFYSGLLALRPLFDSLIDPIAEQADFQQIARFHAMKWHFDVIIKQVEAWRATDQFRLSEHHLLELQERWKSLQNSEEQLRYASSARTNQNPVSRQG